MKKALVTALAVLTCSIFGGTALGQSLPTWNGSFTDTQGGGHLVYPFTMVGGDPSSTGTTTVTTYLIPFKLVFQASDQSQACGSAPVTFDPYKVLSNGQAVVDNVISSPIFTPVPFSQGSGDTLQYIDAFQRANFWGWSRAILATTLS